LPDRRPGAGGVPPKEARPAARARKAAEDRQGVAHRAGRARRMLARADALGGPVGTLQPIREPSPMSEPSPAGLKPASARAFLALLPDLRRSARRLSRSVEDADDLVQETLLKVWSRLAMARAGASDAAPVADLRAYAFATLRNCARTRGQGVPPSGTTDKEAAPEDQSDARADPEAHLAATEAMAALEALPEDQRALLRLRAVEGLSYAEIAAETGLPMGTVTSRLSRGRRALRRALGLPADAAVADLLGSDAGGGSG
jgi:RNA polymerase sigma-70 factor (ECF subfamily)